MKNLLMTGFMLLACGLGFAQDWQTNFEQAKTTAKAENKKVVLVFQGSDWCAPCMKLDHYILSTDQFKQHASSHYVLVKADFPRKKKNALPKEQAEANGRLAERYNKTGTFPLVVVFDGDGKVLGKTGYKQVEPAAYIQELDSF